MIIISKTPYRISFFGGSTDHPIWYKENGGAVLSSSIDKYCHIYCRYLPPFFNYKYNIVYSKTEKTNNIEDIEHPAVKAILKHLNINNGLEMHCDSDLPARSGVGSSSSFVVGLLNALHSLKGEKPSHKELFREAIYIEQKVLQENVGCQDQVVAAYGGFNKISFHNDIKITPIIISKEKLDSLQNHLMLYFTGIVRISSDIVGEQIKQIKYRKKELSTMYNMVDEAIKILQTTNIDDFGKLLHESWMLKRNLTKKISNPKIDNIYDTARNAGALGGKLIGGGGGGFMLLFVKPQQQNKVKEALKNLMLVPIKFENEGAKIIYANDGK